MRGRVLTFEDLPAVDYYAPIPTSYGGFDWTAPFDLLYSNGPALGGAYEAGTASGIHSVFAAAGPTPADAMQPGKAIWKAGGTFDWEGAYFTVFDGSHTIALVGLVHDAGGAERQLYQYTFEARDVRDFVKVDWIGIDEVQIWGGGVVGNPYIRSLWVMDDFTLAPIASVEDEPLKISGIAVSDIDNGDRPMSLTLEVDHGIVTLSATAPGGLLGDAISGNGTSSLTLTGTIATTNATLAYAEGPSYLGNLNFNGRDLIKITATDAGQGASAPLSDVKILGIVVHEVDDAPVAVNDEGFTVTTTPVTIDVLANDTDVDNTRAQLVVSIPTPSVNGDVVVHTDGTITYTAHAGFSGQDVFSYTVDDGPGPPRRT